MKTFTFNKAAAAILNGATLVRVRIRDNTVEVRPTTRTKGLSNLTKNTDAVVAVAPFGRDGARVRIPEQIKGAETLEACKMSIEPAKYGWLVLKSADKPRGPLVTIS